MSAKKKKTKSKKDANPLAETLNKVKNESKMLQVQLDQRRVLTAKARIGKVQAENAQLEAQQLVETVKSDCKDVTAYMSVKYDLSTNKLNEIIRELKNDINTLKDEYNTKCEEYQNYKSESEETISEKDNEIKELKHILATQHMEYETILLEAINKISIYFDDDAAEWTGKSEKLHDELKQNFLDSHIMPPKHF